MSLNRPFAYNTGSTINGTEQYGNLAVGITAQDYSSNIGGVTWWMGPDEEVGYVIAKPVPDGGQPNPLNTEAKVAFSRSTSLDNDSFLAMVNGLPLTAHTFTGVVEAVAWLENNGYWTSHDGTGGNTPAPSASPIPQPGITLQPTPTQTTTPTPTETSCFEYLTDENGNYITDENGNYIVLRELCVSPTPTTTQTNTPTQTTTITPTSSVTPSVTPTNTVTPSITPSVTSSPIPVTGYPFNLVVLPYKVPYSGTTIISNNTGGDTEGATDPNILEGASNPEGIYWNAIDANGVDRTDYFSGFTGQSVTITMTQNGSTAIYSGPVGVGPSGTFPGFVVDVWTDTDPDPNTNSGTGFWFRDAGTAYTENNVTLIQAAPTPWVVGDPVYISMVINPGLTPTPTPTPTPINPNYYQITNNGSIEYVFDNNGDITSNPELTLERGETYIFDVIASGHPFWIKDLNTTGTGNSYNNGVTNNGTDFNRITFTVPNDAPNTLYYVCQFHPNMSGTINIIPPLVTPTPTTTPTNTTTPTTTPTSTTTPTPSITPSTSAQVPWTPTSVISPVAWIDASDSSSYQRSGTSLLGVTDKAGTYTMTYGGNPVTNSSTQNGLNVFDFDGGADYLQSTAYRTQVSSGNHFALGVFRFEGTDSNQDSLWSYEYSSSNNKRDYAISSGASNNTWPGELDLDALSSNRISTTIGNLQQWNLKSLTRNQWHIVACWFNKTGNQIGVRVDGSNAFTPVNDYDNSLQSSQELRLMRNRSSQELDGKLGEFIAYASMPGTSGTDMTHLEKAEGYLAHKWGLTNSLPSSHPYKNTPPTE